MAKPSKASSGAKASRKKKKRSWLAPREDLLTVEEAAESLNCTERNVWTLIKTGRLVYEKPDGRTWISRVEINRYLLLYKDSFIRHAFSRFPSADAAGFGKYVKFGPADGDYPAFELEVTVEEWVRLAAKSHATISEYEKTRAELRRRIKSPVPENFTVRFKIDQTSLARTLDGAIYRAQIPKELSRSYGSEEDVHSMAFEHLIDHVLPRMDRVESDPSDYLAQAVQNFYVDLLRKPTRPEISFGDLDEDDVEALAVNLERKDQIFQHLTRADHPERSPHRKSQK